MEPSTRLSITELGALPILVSLSVRLEKDKGSRVRSRDSLGLLYNRLLGRVVNPIGRLARRRRSRLLVLLVGSQSENEAIRSWETTCPVVRSRRDSIGLSLIEGWHCTRLGASVGEEAARTTRSSSSSENVEALVRHIIKPGSLHGSAIVY